MSGFQIFTNPLEMQKHFEQQMQEVLKSLEQFDGECIECVECMARSFVGGLGVGGGVLRVCGLNVGCMHLL